MDDQTITYLQELMQVTAYAGNSRDAIEKFLFKVREQFVFDNVAVYIQDNETQSLEVTYARAVGRAKHAEADANWGEGFAGQVIAKGKLLLQDPNPDVPPDDRLHQAYLLGLPLQEDGLIKGVLIFVRFGGPVYEESHIKMASVVADLLSMVFERVTWKEMHQELHDRAGARPAVGPLQPLAGPVPAVRGPVRRGRRAEPEDAGESSRATSRPTSTWARPGWHRARPRRLSRRFSGGSR